MDANNAEATRESFGAWEATICCRKCLLNNIFLITILKTYNFHKRNTKCTFTVITHNPFPPPSPSTSLVASRRPKFYLVNDKLFKFLVWRNYEQKFDFKKKSFKLFQKLLKFQLVLFQVLNHCQLNWILNCFLVFLVHFEIISKSFRIDFRRSFQKIPCQIWMFWRFQQILSVFEQEISKIRMKINFLNVFLTNSIQNHFFNPFKLSSRHSATENYPKLFSIKIFNIKMKCFEFYHKKLLKFVFLLLISPFPSPFLSSVHFHFHLLQHF